MEDEQEFASAGYDLQPILTNHYTKQAACSQKIRVLEGTATCYFYYIKMFTSIFQPASMRYNNGSAPVDTT